MRKWLVAVCAVVPLGVTGICLGQEGFVVNPWSTPTTPLVAAPSVAPAALEVAPLDALRPDADRPEAPARSSGSTRAQPSVEPEVVLTESPYASRASSADARSRELMQVELTHTRDVWIASPAPNASSWPPVDPLVVAPWR